MFIPVEVENMGPISICLEAIRNPWLNLYSQFSGTSPRLAFDILLNRAKEIQDLTHSTLLSLLADYGQLRDSMKCEVDPSARFMLTCRFPVSSGRPQEQHVF